MIPCLIVVTLGFIWMLHESDWLRIRLPVGGVLDTTPTIKLYRHKRGDHYYYATTADTSWRYSKRDHTITELSACLDEPLCGWEWLLNHPHPQVSYTIQIEAWGCRNTINIYPTTDASKMKEVCKLAFTKNIRPKNGRKARRKGQLAPNPNYG